MPRDAQIRLWDKIAPTTRRRLTVTLWGLSWLGLLAGLYDTRAYQYVLYGTYAHALLFLVLFRFSIPAFPVQVRIAFSISLSIGVFVPHMHWLLWVNTVGITPNVLLDYCPLVRMLYLLPWNRDEPLSKDYLKRVFLAPPVRGSFQPNTATTAAQV